MARFASIREAKEFLIERIVEEARRDGVALSDVERKMLYWDASQEFDEECEETEYESKIVPLIRTASKRADKDGKQVFGNWTEAIRMLAKEDHYLTFLIDEAGATPRPRGDRLRLWTTASAIVTVGLGAF